MEKKEILDLIQKVKDLTPEELQDNLPPLDDFSKVPNWHKYELDIWKIGEKIRQIINSRKSLRKDKEVYEGIMEICLNPNSKRGRQPFVLLLGYKHLSHFAPALISMINDESIDGQIIDSIYKMRAPGYIEKIEPFTKSETTWIRKLAEKYVTKYGTQQWL